jgi:hypothetical protein
MAVMMPLAGSLYIIGMSELLFLSSGFVLLVIWQARPADALLSAGLAWLAVSAIFQSWSCRRLVWGFHSL